MRRLKRKSKVAQVTSDLEALGNDAERMDKENQEEMNGTQTVTDENDDILEGISSTLSETKEQLRSIKARADQVSRYNKYA